MGGLIVDFGDKTIDLSVQARVTKLNTVLTRTAPLFSPCKSVLILAI